jgi:NADH-quinone oxidoreductase subunit G
VAGITQMGQTGRGEDSEITSYLGETLDSNLQGNIIDLCPVGALVSKPYAFTARPWELTKTESIDVMDALGASIRVDTKGREVMRFLPLNHDGTNEEWISDKTRFVWDGLRRQRLDRPYIRENGKLRPSTWPEALNKAATALKGAVKPAGLVGDLASVEAAFALKGLIEGQGGIVECRTDGAKLPSGNRAAYVGTASIEDIDGAASITLIGSNPRLEAPVLNARLRKAWTRGANVSLIGEAVDLTYDYSHVGTGADAITELLGQDHSVVMAQPSLIILGQGALARGDGAAVLAAAQALAARTQSGLLVLHTAAGRVGAMDVGATNPDAMMGVNTADVIYNLGADEIEIADDAFVIYQGSHGDRGAHRADVILPGAAYTEEPGLFVNTEGRPQLAARASFAPGDAKENWAILRALSGEMDAALPYDSIGALRDAIVAGHPHLGDIDVVAENAGEALAQDQMECGTLVSTVTDFYLSNPIARASQLMAELSANAKARNSEAMAAE